MAAILDMSAFLQRAAPVEYIRGRLGPFFGRLILWIKGQFAGEDPSALVAKKNLEKLDVVRTVAEGLEGDFSPSEIKEIESHLRGFDSKGAPIPDKARLEQFARDAYRATTGFDRVTVGDHTFCFNDMRVERAYQRYLAKEGLAPTEESRREFFAGYMRSHIAQQFNQDKRWVLAMDLVINQGLLAVATRLKPLTHILEEENLLPGVTAGSEVLPRNYQVGIVRNEIGDISQIDLHIDVSYGVRSIETHQLVAQVQVQTTLPINLNESGEIQILEGSKLSTEVTPSLPLSLDQVHSVHEYKTTQGHSLVDRAARWALWGADLLSQNRFEERAASPYLDEAEKFISQSGHQSLKNARQRLSDLKRLYSESGKKRYQQTVFAMVRALFQGEIVQLQGRDIEAKLSNSFKKQFTDLQGNDLRMYVEDNKTQKAMRTQVAFQGVGVYDSSHAYYTKGEKTGSERLYYKALQAEFERHYAGQHHTRHMIQALMTQAVTYDFTADLFEKMAADGYATPGDIPGVAESVILVKNDDHIRYTFKTRYSLLDLDQLKAGEIEVEVALDLRYEGEAWVPRLHQRDIRVIHE